MNKRESRSESVETVSRQDEPKPSGDSFGSSDQAYVDEALKNVDCADAAEKHHQEGTEENSRFETQLEELRQEANDYQQKWLRAQADFDNFRRRSRQEKEEFAKYASMQLIEQLLPIIDNFDRAIVSSKETKDIDSLTRGIEMIYRQLEQVLANEGLQKMEAVGKPFDPEFHQAVAQVESDDFDEGIVVGELQTGYILKNKVLRPAMVQVSK